MLGLLPMLFPCSHDRPIIKDSACLPEFDKQYVNVSE